MGNKNKSGRARKKRFRGNQHTLNRTTQVDCLEVPVPDNVNNDPSETLSAQATPCSSAKKLKLDTADSVDVGNPIDCFVLMNLNILANFISCNLKCGECNQFSLHLDFNDSERDGFCHNISIICTSADCSWRNSFKTSDEVRQGGERGHREVNLRMVTFARSIGRGYSALMNLCQHLNSPYPMSETTYQKIVKKVRSASAKVAEESMKKAAEEVRDTIGVRESEVAKCGVSVDGTWQRRGHSSHHGVVTAISLETDKCLDVEVLSNVCRACQRWEKKKGTREYEVWKANHSCHINHSGSAGSMEAAGSVRIFSRSEEEPRGLQYVKYLGDGDSSSFKKVVDSAPYAGETIEKLECVGHIQKRVGARLRRLKQERKGLKLEDGKGLAGMGRLTDKKIDSLQNYYGFAIRQNVGDLQGMVAAVESVLPHISSTDEKPRHEICPSQWCRYKQDPSTYKHKHGLPDAVVKVVEPIFKDLADESLLRKCLHGKTQNNNECLNKLIWDRCSKEFFVERAIVEDAVFSAVAYYNDGASSVMKIHLNLGINPKWYTSLMCSLKDKVRIEQSAAKSSDRVKKRRKALRAIKKGFIDQQKQVEGEVYTPGGF